MSDQIEQDSRGYQQGHQKHQRGGIIILDFGSQYTQLIARRVREQGVFAELLPSAAALGDVQALEPKGIILSGGPSSVYEPDAPQMPDYVLKLGVPVLGICYGMQLLSHALGGGVAAAAHREYGRAELSLRSDHESGHVSPLLNGLPDRIEAWMSHGDRIEHIPPGWTALAQSANSPFAAMGDELTHRYGVQFHPEVAHTPMGARLLRNFAIDICGCAPDWTTESIIESSTADIRAQVRSDKVLLALSGGVDSAVVAALLERAIPDQFYCMFINHGLLRKGEAEQVIDTFKPRLGDKFVPIDATEEFLSALEGVSDPDGKRRVIGPLFANVLKREGQRIAGENGIRFLAQGTIYPDVIESAASGRPGAKRIKRHHNTELPADLGLGVIEPLRLLFKDEVRQVGEALGLPEAIVWRQPFPGPGLAIRLLGAVTWERAEKLRDADAILLEELQAVNMLLTGTAQSFCVLLDSRSTGVVGDNPIYDEVVAIRAVTTDDFMTVDWARLPYDLLARVSSRITNEVRGVSRVVYDITSKPPATVEWE